ncbi:adenylate/guanylate cyclase domain-containing protein [Planctomicrobium piriforme]|uniref:Adenylate cyclase n=1 Tax=Planctomicrobium piriforme TaxID=1576369 RepID=A0A1I3CAJ4_9PLAN|nr:adenylate/guanylate cyclase domain-containing protein [Planctomicrobium piriforme]SFH71189.1 adenylate cyclase [Planctomicrobium piriforme]
MGYHVSVVAENQLAFTGDFDAPLEMGRQQPGEPGPFSLASSASGPRLVIAAAGDLAVSRRQLRIEELEGGRLRLTNLSSAAVLQLMARPALGPGQQTTMELPCSVSIGSRLFLTFGDISEQTPLKELPEATVLPGRSLQRARADLESSQFAISKEPVTLVQALQTVMDVFLGARSEQELFASAVEGALALIGFDSARVLRDHNGVWLEALVQSAKPNRLIVTAPSQQVLKSVREKKRTFWDTSLANSSSLSLSQVNAVIGAPILDAEGNVIGALYGDRIAESAVQSKDITELDARLMELLACGIASGLARLQQQGLAEQMRNQFAQFFSPELAAELEQNPDLLQGQDAEVSLLFCDIRGFSRISERIGATETFNWIHDVMDVLSDCVLRAGGVLVDYIGDELLAMWGAPRPQEDHAVRACRAAIEMLSVLPELNARWEARLGEPVDLAIGINSGWVKVGNAGSRRKFKYSPLGNAVNLASRVLGTTRHLNTSLLVTGATSKELPDDLPRRKLCDAQVVNMDEPVALYELFVTAPPEPLIHDYAAALSSFEKREFRAAAHLTARLLEQFPDDGPSLVLLSRAVQALVDGPSKDHPLWKLTEK